MDDRHSGPIFYRRARPGDARAIRALIYKVGINPVSLNWRRFLVAVDAQDRLVACGQMKPHNDGTRELASIAVEPGWRGQGIARAIIEKLLAENELPLYLTCRDALGPFYNRFGFREVPPDGLPPYFRRLKRLANMISRVSPRAGRMLVMVKDG